MTCSPLARVSRLHRITAPLTAMSSKEELRIFIGGLSWNTTERHLQEAFSPFGKVVEAQIMMERETGRPRGFGFVTFTDQRAVDDAIAEMHGQLLSGKNITVNKAQPKVASDDSGYGYGSRGGGGYSGGRGSYRGGGDGPPPVGRSECFKCGRSGHWARDCPSEGGGRDSRISSRPRLSGSGGGRGDRYAGPDRYSDRDRYGDDRYDGGRYGDRDRIDTREKYSSGRNDRYDRYLPAGDRDRDRISEDRYGASDRDRYPQNGYGKDRGYERDSGPRGGGSDRYNGGGVTRYEGGSRYRERPGPYERPARGGGRAASYEDRYP